MTIAVKPENMPLRWCDLPVFHTQGEVPFLAEPDIDGRCQSAAAAVATRARLTGEDRPGEEVESLVTGLLADLMHFCDRYGVTDSDRPFSRLVLMAEISFESEKSDEDAQ